MGARGVEDEQQRPAAEGDADELADAARRGGEHDDREQDEDQDDAEVVLPRERARGVVGGASRPGWRVGSIAGW